MSGNEIERIYSEIISIKDVISRDGTPSDIVAYEAIAAKSLILSTASYFEKVVRELLIKHAESIFNSTALISFLDKQALYRKYHTLFDWDRTNINKFIRLFGNEFYDFMEPRLTDEKMINAIKEFMFIGQIRNELVHNNFSEYSIEITSEDIKRKFDMALPLMPFLVRSLVEFEQAKLQAPASND
ncbi:MAG: HEPN domain-containing protein [Thermodesulfovibrionales bacterium]|jgi:hypothetical protein